MNNPRTPGSDDEKYMRRCLQLAQLGYGSVQPNPMVGAVIVREGSVVGEGYHKNFGGDHAEISALKNAGGEARGSVLYVNLEPCNHKGKTPPCTKAIIQSGIREVVYAAEDPNPTVERHGRKTLMDHGITVRSGVLRDEAVRLNEHFYFAMSGGFPFITMKVALTLDGYIADTELKSKWISGEASRAEVQRLRRGSGAVLVGANTVTADNPRLTVRDESVLQPYRVVLDGNLSSPPESRLYNDKHRSRTLIITSDSNKLNRRVREFELRGVSVARFKAVRGVVPLRRVLKYMRDLSLISVLVEGGGTVYKQFTELQLYAKTVCFIAPKIVGGGVPFIDGINRKVKRAYILNNFSVRKEGEDVAIEGYTKLYEKHVYRHIH